ncbi:MAG TPA: tetratricopeptide repeat protein [Gaiellales bacterium]|jgi:tetratricopeptide (TPR) repeat protein
MDVSELHDGEYSNESLRKLGARVRHLRRKRGMTQRDLSFDGCSYSYLARIEAGDRRPSPRVLMEIARRLGVTTEELTGETSPQQRPRSLELLDAMVLARMGRLDESEELLRGVLREAEVNGDGDRMSEACEGLGIVAAERGDDRQAVRLLEHALEVGAPPDPAQRVQLYGRLQLLYRRSGDVARALALLQDCIARIEHDVPADQTKLVRYSLWLSEAYAEAGAFARSAEALSDALADRSQAVDLASRAQAQYAISRNHAASGALDQAIRFSDRALALYELSDDNRALGEAHLAFAQRLLDQNETDAAATHLRAAREVFGPAVEPVERGRLLVEEARQALQAGHGDEAIARATDAVATLEAAADAGHVGDAHLVLARVQDELGELERADTAYSAAIAALQQQSDAAPALARAYRHYGKFLKRLGRAEAALEAFELAADLAPSNQDALAPLPTAEIRLPSDL